MTKPHYFSEELEGLDRLHADQKKKGFTVLKSSKDINKMMKKFSNIEAGRKFTREEMNER